MNVKLCAAKVEMTRESDFFKKTYPITGTRIALFLKGLQDFTNYSENTTNEKDRYLKKREELDW